MNRLFTRVKLAVILLTLPVFVLAGCVAEKQQTKIPTGEIQNRANRSFDDLSAHETGQRKPLSFREQTDERVAPQPEVKPKLSKVRARKGKRPD